MLRTLRTEAEARVAIESQLPELDAKSTTDLVRELQLHVIELRMQNEALREAELSRTRQASALETLSALAAGVAHDFNNMLTAILGCAELARRQVPEGPGLAALDDLRRAVEHSRSLTVHLLSVVRGAARESQADLSAAVCSCEPLMQQLLGPCARLELDLAARRPRVRGDGGQLEQLMLNLVRNAVDAMPDGGVVRVSTRDVLASELPPPLAAADVVADYCMLSVSDAGTGMEPQVAARAFEPFFTTKGELRGTGLGLWMVEATVRGAGGHVELDTSPGAGTTVKVYLPCVAASASAA